MTKSNKGITLVALVITIVVLLVIAVVTIGVVQESGIIGHAQNAATVYNDEKSKEESAIAGYESLIESKVPGGNGGSKVTYKDGVPVPAGFYYVTGTKDTGFVISDNSADENNASGKSGNQFVWVPVEKINTMVMCKSKTASDQCNIKLNEAKTALLCETHSNSTDICGKLYSSIGDRNINSSRTNQTYTDTNKEPYNLSEETNTTYQAEFNEMAVSVAKNGGFYVGRYEVSFSAERKAQSKGSAVEPYVYSAINSTTSSNNNNATDWYGLYSLCKTYNTSSVKSSMIWGSQYDAMLIWMGNDATNFNTNNRNNDAQRRTGYSSTDEIRNVYDLVGNSYEWTLEAGDTISRVIRGDFYLFGSSPSIRAFNRPTSTNSTSGSRLTLYIV